jgi:protein involved in polysaccharide export with SLBB domain
MAMHRWIRALAALAAALPWIIAVPAQAADYQLEPQDKLRIRVVEWRSAESTSQEWTALSGEYSVAADGTVSLPLIGVVEARGRSANQLAEAISAGLKERMALTRRPETSVQIIEYRPVYILGEVERPGEYPYRPGLTALQAIGVAGGQYRGDGAQRIERETISVGGDAEVTRLAFRRALARQARLRAEIAGADTITPPPELANGDGPQILADEASIMAARRQAFDSQIKSIESLKQLLNTQIQALDQKMVTMDKTLELSRKELKTVSTLVQKGLSVTSRSFDLERNVADLETRRLDLDTASLKAKQDLSEAERDALDLTTKRNADMLQELQRTQSEIDQLAARLATQNNLLAESSAYSGRLAAIGFTGRKAELSFRITRQAAGKSVTTEATEDSLVMPGDVLRVERVERPASDVSTSSIAPPPVPAPAKGKQAAAPARRKSADAN